MGELIMTFPKPLAILIGFWVAAFLHGMYLLLFLRWATVNHTARKGPWKSYYTGTTWSIFFLSNIATAINLVQLVMAFWESTTNGGGGPSAFFRGPLNWENQWREYNFQAIMSLLNLMMTHRLWVIWDRNYYIASFVFFIWLLELVFGTIAPCRLRMPQTTELVFVVKAQLALDVSLQVLLTSVISYRIIGPQDDGLKYLPNQHRRRRTKIVQCFVESGALVTTGIIVDMIFYDIKNNLHWTFNLALTECYAISSIMIVLRLHGVLENAPQPSLNTIIISAANATQSQCRVSPQNQGDAVPRTSIAFQFAAPQGLLPHSEEVDDEKVQTRLMVVAEDSLSITADIDDNDQDRRNNSAC